MAQLVFLLTLSCSRNKELKAVNYPHPRCHLSPADWGNKRNRAQFRGDEAALEERPLNSEAEQLGEGNLFGIRALEHGFTGGVPQSRRATVLASTIPFGRQRTSASLGRSDGGGGVGEGEDGGDILIDGDNSSSRNIWAGSYGQFPPRRSSLIALHPAAAADVDFDIDTTQTDSGYYIATTNADLGGGDNFTSGKATSGDEQMFMSRSTSFASGNAISGDEQMFTSRTTSLEDTTVYSYRTANNLYEVARMNTARGGVGIVFNNASSYASLEELDAANEPNYRPYSGSPGPAFASSTAQLQAATLLPFAGAARERFEPTGSSSSASMHSQRTGGAGLSSSPKL